MSHIDPHISTGGVPSGGLNTGNANAPGVFNNMPLRVLPTGEVKGQEGLRQPGSSQHDVEEHDPSALGERGVRQTRKDETIRLSVQPPVNEYQVDVGELPETEVQADYPEHEPVTEHTRESEKIQDQIKALRARRGGRKKAKKEQRKFKKDNKELLRIMNEQGGRIKDKNKKEIRLSLSELGDRTIGRGATYERNEDLKSIIQDFRETE